MASFAVVILAALLYATRPDGGVRDAGRVVGYRPVPAPPTVVTVRPAPGIVFVGDSISANWYASTPPNGFRELLTAALGGTQAAAAIHPGYTIRQMLPLVAAMREPSAPGALDVVELGTNDASQHVDPATSAANYDELLTRLTADTPGARLLCVGVWADPTQAPVYDDVLSGVCEAHGGVYVILSDLYARTSLRGPDGSASYLGSRDDFHPNDAGHEAIAQRLASVVHQRR